MIFLNDNDFGPQIKTEILNIIRGSQTNQDTAELAAIAEMKSYLNGKYNTTAIFSSSGTDRNPQLVMYLVDILLYHLHSNITPRNIPEIREKRYEAAISWLKMVASDKLNPNLPISEQNQAGNFKLGSNSKVSKKW